MRETKRNAILPASKELSLMVKVGMIHGVLIKALSVRAEVSAGCSDDPEAPQSTVTKCLPEHCSKRDGLDASGNQDEYIVFLPKDP